MTLYCPSVLGSVANAAMGAGLRLRGPNQQTSDGMAHVEGIKQPTHLVAIPDVAPLELGQGHVAAVDVVEDGGDFQESLSSSRDREFPCKFLLKTYC
jgi:hypothetical protein